MSMRQSFKFFGHFLRHPRQVGAVWPSSPQLASAMTRGLAGEPGHTIVELGPGNGAFTQAILHAKHADAPYLGIEINASFVRTLTQRFPEARFVAGSAERMVELHRDAELPVVRDVLCGLPFASLPIPVQDGVLAGLNTLLQHGGTFTTFQYVHAYHLPAARRFRQRMSQLFGQVQRSQAVMRNAPPAFVLRWSRSEAQSEN